VPPKEHQWLRWLRCSQRSLDHHLHRGHHCQCHRRHCHRKDRHAQSHCQHRPAVNRFRNRQSGCRFLGVSLAAEAASARSHRLQPGATCRARSTRKHVNASNGGREYHDGHENRLGQKISKWILYISKASGWASAVRVTSEPISPHAIERFGNFGTTNPRISKSRTPQTDACDRSANCFSQGTSRRTATSWLLDQRLFKTLQIAGLPQSQAIYAPPPNQTQALTPTDAKSKPY